MTEGTVPAEGRATRAPVTQRDGPPLPPGGGVNLAPRFRPCGPGRGPGAGPRSEPPASRARAPARAGAWAPGAQPGIRTGVCGARRCGQAGRPGTSAFPVARGCETENAQDALTSIPLPARVSFGTLRRNDRRTAHHARGAAPRCLVSDIRTLRAAPARRAAGNRTAAGSVRAPRPRAGQRWDATPQRPEDRSPRARGCGRAVASPSFELSSPPPRARPAGRPARGSHGFAIRGRPRGRILGLRVTEPMNRPRARPARRPARGSPGLASRARPLAGARTGRWRSRWNARPCIRWTPGTRDRPCPQGRCRPGASGRACRARLPRRARHHPVPPRPANFGLPRGSQRGHRAGRAGRRVATGRRFGERPALAPRGAFSAGRRQHRPRGRRASGPARLAPCHEGQPFEQHHVLLVLDERTMERRHELARVALAQGLKRQVLVQEKLQPVEELRR